MTTRSGRSYKQHKEMSAESFEKILQTLMDDRRKREEEIAAERAQREKEVQTQMDMMKEQMESLVQIVRGTQTTSSRTSGGLEVKLVPLKEKDDIEAYLMTFERIMRAHQIEEERWPQYLAPQLTGKAQLAFAAMPTIDAGSYESIKTAIFTRYDLNVEAYRRKFRTTVRRSDETNRELAVRIGELQAKWMRECHTVEEMAEVIRLEQFLNAVPRDVRVWVSEKKPTTCLQAGELADEYEQLRKRESDLDRRNDGPRRCHTCGQPGHLAKDCRKGRKTEGAAETPQKNEDKTGKNLIRCYNCGQRGHVALKCPSAALFCGSSHVRPAGRRLVKRDVYKSGLVEGRRVEKVVLDTGCSQTMVHKDLVPQDKIVEGDAVTIRCAHGDTVLYPLAEIELEVDGHPISIEAAVSETLPVDVLLGTDVPELTHLLGETALGKAQVDAMVVMTRARARQQREEESVIAEKEAESGVLPSSVESTGEDSEEEIIKLGNSFDNDIFVPGKEKVKLTRGDKRKLHQKYWERNEEKLDKHVLELSAATLKELQEQDESLLSIRKNADRSPGLPTSKYYHRDGLLYRRWTPPGRDDGEMDVEQLVLPKACRRKVMELAHEIPLAGHMGKEKTRRRILQRFYWPTLYKDVEEYCKCCLQCQKSNNKGVQWAPLIPLPIVGEPFKRIAMDIIGPLPKSRSGNRFILVICDYATRYPEAIPLKRIDAEHIAEELVQVFARVGMPQEILTDQGSNFTSQLLAELYQLLHIHPIRTTPYHPQTDGLVERFNQTLKAMLRKVATKKGRDWDKLVPYILFAYREVPQASTGFSPFELLYGRNVRGPLDILRESWEASKSEDDNIVSYVLLTREKLTKMTELVQQNLAQAQERQKNWYDRNARVREFQPGDQILVLLPTATSKLLAQWQGPYEVVKRIGKVDYVIDMHDRRKRKRIFHVNMLRKFHVPKVSETNYFLEGIDDDIREEEIPVWNEDPEGQPLVGTQLDIHQKEKLYGVIKQFTDVLQNTPGRTNLTVHHIETGSALPVRLPPYRLPHAYRDAVRAELQQMLEGGIIEHSSSEWASPIVIVNKKDGSLRLCVDYRKLNSVSQSDAYPMPRIDELIDGLGQSRYISTFDLTRGYWQVPVSERDCPKTAFNTPFGLYQFNVMPFGLQGAPATFQRMMDYLVDGCGAFAAAYLDDLVVFSGSWEDHLIHLIEIFKRLRRAGLTAKPSKCQFAMHQCTYLGHVVGNGLVRPETTKVEAVQQFPTPGSKTDVRAFLGLTGYYRKFIPGYATVSSVLSDLTRKSAPNKVVWTPQCEKAFVELKRLLCSAPVLKAPDFSRLFILQTDASDRGIGAVLSQTDKNEDDHPVAYFSKKLLPREQRYSTVEKECLAIKLATHAFRVYLLGRKFIIQTDHRALEWLDRLKENNARLTRWSLSLQPYHFVVNYRSGSKNGNADALSRIATN